MARIRPENAEPDYQVVADGHWLVFDVSLGMLYTLTGEQFSGEFEPTTAQAASGGGYGETSGCPRRRHGSRAQSTAASRHQGVEDAAVITGTIGVISGDRADRFTGMLQRACS